MKLFFLLKKNKKEERSEDGNMPYYNPLVYENSVSSEEEMLAWVETQYLLGLEVMVIEGEIVEFAVKTKITAKIKNK